MNASARAASPIDTIFLLSRARSALVRDVDRAVSGHGISFADLGLLRRLAAAPQHRLRRSELAHALGVTPSAIARQVAPLERIGLIDREPNARDARLALVVLTDAGQRVTDEASAIADEHAADLLDDTWSAEQQAQLASLLSRAVR